MTNLKELKKLCDASDEESVLRLDEMVPGIILELIARVEEAEEALEFYEGNCTCMENDDSVAYFGGCRARAYFTKRLAADAEQK